MTKDDIIKLAREAGFEGMTDHPALMRFANFIAEHKTEVALAEAYRCGVEAAAAAELRRLHELNAELLEALKDATEGLEIASAGGGVDFYAYAKTSRAAIAKAEGEMK